MPRIGGWRGGQRIVKASVSETRAERSILRPGMRIRTGPHGLAGTAFQRLVRFPVANRRPGRLQPMKKLRVPGIVARSRAALRGAIFLRAALFAHRLLQADHKPRQGRGGAKDVTGREPGHASAGVAGFAVRRRPEVE